MIGRAKAGSVYRPTESENLEICHLGLRIKSLDARSLGKELNSIGIRLAYSARSNLTVCAAVRMAERKGDA